MKRVNWNHVMAWATMFAILGTSRVWAGPNAWKNIGPEGGEIYALSVDPHNPRTLYVATGSGGAFKSLDGGASWVKSDVPNRPNPLVFDPQDPDTIYAFDLFEGISKSTDGGTSWNPANSGVRLPYPVLALAIDPLKPSTLYAGTFEGILKSTDGGTNWSPASSGLPQLKPFPLDPLRPTSVVSMVIDPQNPSTLYAVSDGQALNQALNSIVYDAGELVKSTDGGGSWNTVDLGLPESHFLQHPVLAIDPQNPSTLYVGTNYGIFKSTDQGADWSPVNSGLPPFETGLTLSPAGAYFQAVTIDPRQPDTVYAAIGNSYSNRIFKTTNGGASWSDAGSGLWEGTFVRSLKIDPQIPATLYAGTSVGVFKSTDGGTSWTAANSGLTAMLITDVAIDPRNANTLYAATSIGLFKTTDGGTNWSGGHSNVARMGYTLAIDPQNSSTVFAPGCAAAGSGVSPSTGPIRSIVDCGVFKSTDGGTSWSASWIIAPDSFTNLIKTLAIDPQDSKVVYATTQFLACGLEWLNKSVHGGITGLETLDKSVDGGMSWSHSLFDNMGVSAGCVSELVVDPQDSRNLYAAFWYGGVFKSTDAGTTWKAANSGLSLDSLALAIDPSTPGTVYTVSSSGVFKSNDGGMSWNPAGSGLPDWSSELGYCCFNPRLAVDPQNSARVYLGIAIDNALHVFQSSDGGASWTDSLVGSGSNWIFGLAISSQGPSTVYVGTNQGLFAMTFPPEP